jgi:hypothetical protein
VAVCVVLGEDAIPLQPSLMVIPILGVYLMGARKGLILSVIQAVYLGVIHPFFFARPDSLDWLFSQFTASSLLMICVISWLFRRSSRRSRR